MPGFLGTPAGMTTISAPTRESFSWSSPVNIQYIHKGLSETEVGGISYQRIATLSYEIF